MWYRRWCQVKQCYISNRGYNFQFTEQYKGLCSRGLSPFYGLKAHGRNYGPGRKWGRTKERGARPRPREQDYRREIEISMERMRPRRIGGCVHPGGVYIYWSKIKLSSKWNQWLLLTKEIGTRNSLSIIYTLSQTIHMTGLGAICIANWQWIGYI